MARDEHREGGPVAARRQRVQGGVVRRHR
jgi:hypothetical protein